MKTATKRQVTIAGISVSCMGLPNVEVIETTWTEEGPIRREKVLAEYGSRIVEEAMAGYPGHWLRGFYSRFAEVLRKNHEYIMGAEGVACEIDTEGDRRLVAALAAGAVMDPETGVIPGYDL